MAILHKSARGRIDFLDERFYTTDGIHFYPSVTTVLEVLPKGAGYYQWLKDVGNNADIVMRRAADSGSKVHHAIEQYLLRKVLKWTGHKNKGCYSWEEWQMINRFVDFWQSHSPRLLAVELTMISDIFCLGGTLDIICYINNELWIIDTKTSNQVYDSHALQLAAYAMMWNERHEEKVQHIGVMHLKAYSKGKDKTGKKIQGEGWKLHEFEEPLSSLWESFCDLRRIWDRQNPNYKPKNLSLPDRLKLKP